MIGQFFFYYLKYFAQTTTTFTILKSHSSSSRLALDIAIAIHTSLWRAIIFKEFSLIFAYSHELRVICFSLPHMNKNHSACVFVFFFVCVDDRAVHLV